MYKSESKKESEDQNMDNHELKKYINIEEGLGRLLGNKTLFKRILTIFSASDAMDRLEKDFNEGNLQKASEVAHEIKGMAGNLSLTALYTDSADLMVTLRTGICEADRVAECRRIWNITEDVVKQVLVDFQ